MTQPDQPPSYPGQPNQQPPYQGASSQPPYPGQANQPPYPSATNQPQYPWPSEQPQLYSMPSYPSPFGNRPEAPVERPATLRNGVWLMLAGAVLSAISLLYSLLTFNSQMDEATGRLRNMPNVTPEIINMAHTVALTAAVFSGVVSILLWLWMAWMNHQGRKWARIVATILAAFSLFSAPVSWAQSSANGMQVSAAQIILPLLTMIAGIGAVVLIWLRPSSEYYAFQSRQRRARR